MKKVMLFVLSCILGVCSFGTVAAYASEKEDGALSPSCKAAYLCDWQTGTVMYETSAEKLQNMNKRLRFGKSRKSSCKMGKSPL